MLENQIFLTPICSQCVCHPPPNCLDFHVMLPSVKSLPKDDIDWRKLFHRWHPKDKRHDSRCSECIAALGKIVSLHWSQMLTYRKMDLDVEHKRSYAYTATPAHPLGSVTASAIWFFGCDQDQIQLRAPSTDALYTGTCGGDKVLEGLCYELNSYLDELQMPHIRHTSQDLQINPVPVRGPWPQVCDPLWYWKVYIFPSHFHIPHLFA